MQLIRHKLVLSILNVTHPYRGVLTSLHIKCYVTPKKGHKHVMSLVYITVL